MSTLTVYIGTGEEADTTLEDLKKADYKLCIVKEVGGNFTVVWQGIADLLYRNEFQWADKYKVFGTSSDFQDGALVEVSTEVKGIDYGQTCKLDQFGKLDDATG